VALTFDDGPHVYTSDLLDLLKSNGVVATFFVNGQNWGDDTINSATKSALIRRMIADGHQVGSHTWNHPDLSTLSAADVTTQMTDLEAAFTSILGFSPTYMRPPYFSCGSTCLGVMNSLAYHVINCDLDTLDWAYNTADTIQTSVNIFNQAVVGSSPSSRSWLPLAHDVHSTTVYTLTQAMITSFKAQGFQSATVGTCMGDPQSNWYRTL
jgi:peptidoglycan/xylan/chitin deacetylase (PgdA/CDA1 family)